MNASAVLLDLINEVLDISKIEADKVEIIEKEYDLIWHRSKAVLKSMKIVVTNIQNMSAVIKLSTF